MSGKLQHEIGKSRPFESLEQEVALNLFKTADVLASEGTELLKPYGLSGTQYNVLRILRGNKAGCCAGGHLDPGAAGIACREIGEQMITRDPDVTRLLDRLEERGLITRGRDVKDRRVISTRITEAGLELLAKLDGPVIEMHQRQLGHLGEAKLHELLSLLELARSR